MRAHILFCAVISIIFILSGGCSSGSDRPVDGDSVIDGDSDTQTGDVLDDDGTIDGDSADDSTIDGDGDGDSDSDIDGDSDTPADEEKLSDISYTIECQGATGIDQWFAWSHFRSNGSALQSIGDGRITWNRGDDKLWFLDLSDPDSIPSPRIAQAPASGVFSGGWYYFDGAVYVHHDKSTFSFYKDNGDTFEELGRIRFNREFKSAALLSNTLYVYVEYEETFEDPYGEIVTATTTRPVTFNINQPACPVFVGTGGVGNPDYIFTRDSLHLAMYSGISYEPYPDDVTSVYASLMALDGDTFCRRILYAADYYGMGYQPVIRFIQNYAMIFETLGENVDYEYDLYQIYDISDPCNLQYAYSGRSGETMPDIGFTDLDYRAQPNGICSINYQLANSDSGWPGFQESSRHCHVFPVSEHQGLYLVGEPENKLNWYLFHPQHILYAVSATSEAVSARAAWQLVENEGEPPVFVPYEAQ